MDINIPNIDIPFVIHSLLWLLLGAALFGGAVSRATRRVKRRGPEGKKNHIGKWGAVLILLVLAGVFAILGLNQPEVAPYLDENPNLHENPNHLVYLTGGIALLTFIALRFKRVVGLPVLGLGVLTTSLSILLLQSLVAFTGETEIGEVAVLSNRDGVMQLDVRLQGQEPTRIALDGEYFAPVVKVVIFDDHQVLLGRKTWYRFEGMISFRLEHEGGTTRFRQSGTDYYFQQASGIGEALYRRFEANEDSIPGVKSVQVDLDLKRVWETKEQPASPPKVYSLMLQNDGGVQIVSKDR